MIKQDAHVIVAGGHPRKGEKGTVKRANAITAVVEMEDGQPWSYFTHELKECDSNDAPYLWLLTPRSTLTDLHPSCTKAAIVRAFSEDCARAMIQLQQENGPVYRPWENSIYTKCVKIGTSNGGSDAVVFML